MQREEKLKLKTGMHWLTQDRNSSPGASPGSSRKALEPLRHSFHLAEPPRWLWLLK